MPKNRNRDTEDSPTMSLEEMEAQKEVFKSVLRGAELYLFAVVRVAFQCAKEDREITEDESRNLEKVRGAMANVLQSTLVR